MSGFARLAPTFRLIGVDEIAEWPQDALRSGPSQTPGLRVADLIPEGFPLTVRVLHPAGDPEGRPVRWAEVARWSGRDLHAAAQFELLAAPTAGATGPQPWTSSPSTTPDRSTAIALAAVLGNHTADPDQCFFGVWEGYTDLHEPPTVLARRRPLARLPHRLRRHGSARRRLAGVRTLSHLGRTYAVATGSLGAVATGLTGDVHAYQAPNLWWPPDRAWFVCSDIDLTSTYVGCGEECAATLLQSPDLEALAVDPSTRVDLSGDEINRP